MSSANQTFSTTKLSRQARVFGVALFATVAIALHGGQPARAGSFIASPCGSVASNELWTSGGSLSTWLITKRCPYEISLQSNGQVGSSADGYFSYLERSAPGLTIDTVSFNIKGSSGRTVNASQGLRVCSAITCGPMFEPSGAAYDYIKLPRGSPSIPAGSTHVRIGGKCLGSGTCGPTQPVVIYNLEIQYLDTTKPTLEIDTGQTDLLENEWNSGEKYFVFRAEDAEAGIFYTEVTRTQIQPLVFEDCGLRPYWPRTYSLMCPTATETNYVTMSDPYRSIWSEGQNTITLSAHDAARNVSQIEYPFKLDRVAPVVAPDLAVSGINDADWIHTSVIDISWGNWGDSFENETESGIAKATYSAQLFPYDDPEKTIWGEVEEPGIDSIPQIPIPSDGKWYVSVQTTDKAGNVSTGAAGRVLQRDTRKLNAPQIDSVGWIGPRNVSDDVVWQRPSNVADSISGVCGYALSVDDFSQSSPGEEINILGDVTQANLPYGTDDGQKWIHLRAISCAGLPGAISHSSIGVDTTRPDANLEPISGAWHTSSSPAVINSSDENSGVDHLVYWIDGGPDVEVAGPSASLSLEDGAHEIEFFAQDAAGNRSITHKGTVQFDESPPTALVKPADATDPTLIEGIAADPTAGIARAWLEYRRVAGTDPWLPLAFVNARTNPEREVALTGRFPDEEAEPGDYELRVVAEDAAGNATVGAARKDGSRAVVTAPLRQRPLLTTGFPTTATAKSCQVKRCGATRASDVNVLQSLQTVPFGRQTQIVGRLTMPDGKALVGGRIEIFSQVARTQTVKRFATTTTGADGRFSVQVASGPSRQFTARSAGTKLLLSARSDSVLLTKASSTLSANPRSVTGGRPVTLQGQLALGGVQLGSLGKQVTIEARVGKRWKPLATVTAGSNGFFRATWHPRRVRQRVRFALRASVPRATDWPYEAGVSRTIHVVVKP